MFSKHSIQGKVYNTMGLLPRTHRPNSHINTLVESFERKSRGVFSPHCGRFYGKKLPNYHYFYHHHSLNHDKLCKLPVFVKVRDVRCSVMNDGIEIIKQYSTVNKEMDNHYHHRNNSDSGSGSSSSSSSNACGGDIARSNDNEVNNSDKKNVGNGVDSQKMGCSPIEVVNHQNENIFTKIARKYPHTRPYIGIMRLEKPIGTYLLLWPCLWSLGLAYPLIVDPQFIHFIQHVTYFTVGAIVMRGAGCTINDLWDRDIDKMVERTKIRPLASGTMSPSKAIIFLGAQLSVGLAILLQFNLYTILIGASSLLLVVIYPLMKRITYWPQTVLGLTFNWGAFVGYASVVGSHALMNWNTILPLYFAGICWTLIYDTIYAHQDKKDDKMIGVKSTALLFGSYTKQWLLGFAILMTASLCIAGYYHQFYTSIDDAWPYYLAVMATFVHLIHQIFTVDYNNTNDCMKKFVSNKWVGLILFTGIMASNLIMTRIANDREQSHNVKAESSTQKRQ